MQIKLPQEATDLKSEIHVGNMQKGMVDLSILGEKFLKEFYFYTCKNKTKCILNKKITLVASS